MDYWYLQLDYCLTTEMIEMREEILLAGIFDMAEEEYHADPCPEPSLSASLAHTIVNHTAMHAKLNHPRLTKNRVREESTTFDLGRAAHKMVLEPEKENFVIIDAEDWRSSKAREERDNARSLGKVPLLQCDYLRVKDMAETSRSFLDDAYIEERPLKGLLQRGKSEQTMIAQDGCWLRGRLDFISDDRDIIVDYKTVSRTANPDLFLRNSVFNYGYDIQAAMYCHLNQLLGYKGRAEYIWLIQETEYPYACSITGASSSVLECGMDKVNIAKALWCQSLVTNKFDGYSSKVVWLDAPPWEIAKVEEMHWKLFK